MLYNYLEEMKADILEYLYDEGAEYKGLDREELAEALRDDLWDNDSITGNGSGAYFSTTQEAKKAVMDNMGLCIEALREFCAPMEMVADKFLSQEWEYFDVTIRCYLLGQAIEEALDDYEER